MTTQTPRQRWKRMTPEEKQPLIRCYLISKRYYKEWKEAVAVDTDKRGHMTVMTAPETAFTRFYKSSRVAIRTEHPKIQQTDVHLMVFDHWMKLSDDEKAQWESKKN